MIHTVKGFGIVIKAKIDAFLELFCFFDDPVNIDNLISSSSAFSKTRLNIWKFTVHMLLKPGLENFEHYFIRDPLNSYFCLVGFFFFFFFSLLFWLDDFQPDLEDFQITCVFFDIT